MPTTTTTYVLSFAQVREYPITVLGQHGSGEQPDMRWQADPEFLPYAITRVIDDIVDHMLSVKLALIVNGVPDKEKISWVSLRKERLAYQPIKGDTLWIYQRSEWGYPRGKVFWHITQSKKSGPLFTACVYNYQTWDEVQRDAALADAARREQKIKLAAERSEEFAARTATLPAPFQEKIARHRALDPVGYAVDFEGTMLDIYETAVDILARYAGLGLSKEATAKNIHNALPETIYSRVPRATTLERPQVYEALALAYELCTNELPDWATQENEES